MSEAIIPVVNTLITSVVSLAVAFGTWHVTIKKDREKQVEEVKTILNEHREEYISGIRDVKDDVSQVQATVQSQIGIIEYEIKTLSDRVDKHNNVLERTYDLENVVAVQREQIRNLTDNVDAIRRNN